MMISILHNYFRVQFFTVYGERLRMLQLGSGKVFSSMREKLLMLIYKTVGSKLERLKKMPLSIAAYFVRDS